VSEQKRLDQGTAVHEKWERYFKQSGLLFSTKHKMRTSDPPFSGEPDFIIMDPEFRGIYVIELKSRDFFIFSKQFGALRGHIRQWGFYDWMVEQFYGVKPLGGWIHYEDLNRQEWKSYPMVRNENWLNNELNTYRGWAKIAEKCREDIKLLPPLGCSGEKKGDQLFQRCPLRESCLELLERK
jgi:hypothetical protein